MYKLNITSNTVDALVKDILIQDYKALLENTKRLEEKLLTILPYEFEDLVNNRRFCSGFKILMDYYFTDDELKEMGLYEPLDS